MKKVVYFYESNELDNAPSDKLDGTFGPYVIDYGAGPYIDVHHALDEAPFDVLNVWDYEAGKRRTPNEINDIINDFYDDWFARP